MPNKPKSFIAFIFIRLPTGKILYKAMICVASILYRHPEEKL